LFKTSELFALTLAGRVFLDERLEIFETAGKFLEAQPANWLTVGRFWHFSDLTRCPT